MTEGLPELFFPFEAGDPDIGYLFLLQWDEFTALWALTCLWKRDNDPGLGQALSFDELMRRGLLKLQEDYGYTWKGLEIDVDLTVVGTTDDAPAFLRIKGFLEALGSSVMVEGAMVPNYESAFRRTQQFLKRELPDFPELDERIQEELAFIQAEVDEALSGRDISSEELRRIIRESEERTWGRLVH